jgi:hypothetical protein
MQSASICTHGDFFSGSQSPLYLDHQSNLPFSLEQMIGKTDWDFLPPEQAPHLMEPKQQILTKGISLREELLGSPHVT